MSAEMEQDLDVSNKTVETPMGNTDNSEEVVKDAFAYTDRDDFTSEKFKIEIRNLRNRFGRGDLKKLLNKRLSLGAKKIKRVHPKSTWVYACFESEEARIKAIDALNGFHWKGRKMLAMKAKASPDPLVLKRLDRMKADEDVEPLTEETLTIKLKDKSTPLWRMPYEEQLIKKTNNIQTILKKLAFDIEEVNPDLSDWLTEQKTKNNGLLCEMLPIRHPKNIDGYRNKCEFAIGKNDLTGETTIGLRIGTYAQGSLCVVSPEAAPHISDIMKKAAKLAENFVKTSGLDIYNHETHTGHWRELMVRAGSRTNQLMMYFILHPQNLSSTELDALKEKLKSYFQTGNGAELGVTSLWMAFSSQESSAEPINVMGEPFIYDEVLGCRFRISPQAFFQPNTECADILYESISEMASVTENTTLVDVCCGAGTIGICLSKNCGEVLGIEMVEHAVADAKLNASANEVKNAEFYHGKAEDLLSPILHRAKFPHVIAVVDPPRAGLGRSAISQLRRMKNLKSFVYAACQPESAAKNFVDFARMASKQYRNDPFVPVRCVPVDMLPYTDQCELVVLFERWTQKESQES